jgi:hypothetical protein
MSNKLIDSLRKNNKKKSLPKSKMHLRFDAYRASVWDVSPDQLLSLFPLDECGLYCHQGPARFQSYTCGIFIKDVSGKQVGRILWGDAFASVFLEVKGLICDEVVYRLRERFHHQVTRADLCLDWFEPGKFDQLLTSCMAVKKMNKQIRSQKFGDWDDHVEDGRTYYVGSSKSLCQIVLYEKGRQPEHRRDGFDDWVRLEWRIRPEGKQQKLMAASMAPHDLISLSAMGRRLAEVVLFDYDGSMTPRLPKPKSSERNSFEHMVWQYTPTMRKLALKEGVGIEQVLAEIGLALTGRPWVAQEIDCEYAY